MTAALVSTKINSPIGPLVLEATEDGLVGLSFGSEDSERGVGSDVDDGGVVVESSGEGPDSQAQARGHLIKAVDQVIEYLSGRRERFDVQIDWSRSSGFRQDVLRRLLEDVDFGNVVTYGELAGLVGKPRAARAVGTAMATNPIAVVVPCHRVVRAGRVVGAYGGGVEAKQWLLELEGAVTGS